MSQTKKFIVWDWNGTLLDDTDAVLTCMNTSLSRIQCAPVTMEKLRDTQFVPLRNFYLSVGVPEEKLSEFLNFERGVFHDAYEALEDKAPLRTGASKLLQRLKTNNIVNLIVSNHILDQIARLLHSHKIAEYFEEVLAYPSRALQFRDMTKGEKLHAYIKEKNLNASNAMIVGDTHEEIAIARELGMGSIAITNGLLSERRLRDMRPDYVVHSLDEIHPILEQRGFVQ